MLINLLSHICRLDFTVECGSTYKREMVALYDDRVCTDNIVQKLIKSGDIDCYHRSIIIVTKEQFDGVFGYPL